MGNENKKPFCEHPDETYERVESVMMNYQLTLAFKLISEGSNALSTALLLDCDYTIIAYVNENIEFLTAVRDTLEVDYEIPRHLVYRVMHDAGISTIVLAKEFADAGMVSTLLGMAGYVERAKEERRTIDAEHVCCPKEIADFRDLNRYLKEFTRQYKTQAACKSEPADYNNTEGAVTPTIKKGQQNEE